MRKTNLMLIFTGACCAASCGIGAATAGCSVEDCQLMFTTCRVTLSGGPSEACWQAAQAPAGFDYIHYCVESCRYQQQGALVQCIANASQRCAAADGGDERLKIVGECDTAVPVDSDTACQQRCEAARKDCDLTCVGGERCAQCNRVGQSCDGCFGGSFAACADCSAACGEVYVDCARNCM
jgi:hypothetical protein